MARFLGLNWRLPITFGSADPLPRDEDGMYLFARTQSPTPVFNDISDDVQKLKIVFSNPAVLKVFKLQCDLFSLGKVKVMVNDVEQKNDPLLNLLANPNPMQSGTQLLWDFMFYSMLGNAYCYVDSNVVLNETNKLYLLQPDKMIWPRELEAEKDKLIFSKQKENEIFKMQIEYRYDDGSSIKIPLNKIISIADLTNGNGNWFKSNSCLDALYKIIANADEALNANNINTRYTGKFLVAGQADPKNVTQLPLSEPEKQDIESKMNSSKQVHAVKSMIDIKRFVENLKDLDLGTNYLNQYFLIGNMYNIPRDVLEAYVSSTYENQEKARASHVSYTLQPKGNDYLQALGKRFGYVEAGKQLCIDWTHLPFMQVFERDRATTKQIQVTTLTNLLKLKVPIEEANKFLGTNFSNAKYEQPKPTNAPANGGGN